MPVKIQKVPFSKELMKLANSAKTSLKITSPFITFKGIQYILNSEVKPLIITRVTASNLASYALDAKALKHLIILGAEIRSIPNLHAKVYLVDNNQGIITSSNLTDSGISKNVELGVYFYNEEELFKSTEEFFNNLWEKATPVSIADLESMESKIKSFTIKDGIYYSSENEEDENIVPVPAIGNLYFSNEDTNLDATFTEINAPDECGDFFIPLPSNSDNLIKGLSSTSKKTVQAYVNSISLISDIDFKNWLNKISNEDFDQLINPNKSYPYKRYVIKKIISACSVAYLIRLLMSLIVDTSNESQLIKYYYFLTERVRTLSKKEKDEFLSGIYHITNYLKLNINSAALESKKNFAKPNLDKINELILLAGGKEDKVEITLKHTDTGIPGYQQIKRQREALGDEFWNYANNYFEDISLGKWNSSMQSISSLFKELKKIKLNSQQKQVVQQVSRRSIQQIKSSLSPVKDEITDQFTNMIKNATLTETQKEQVKKALSELDYNTGRLIQIYGQWSGNGIIDKNYEFKKKLDFLTTGYMTLKVLKEWTK